MRTCSLSWYQRHPMYLGCGVLLETHPKPIDQIHCVYLLAYITYCGQPDPLLTEFGTDIRDIFCITWETGVVVGHTLFLQRPPGHSRSSSATCDSPTSIPNHVHFQARTVSNHAHCLQSRPLNIQQPWRPHAQHVYSIPSLNHGCPF